MVDIGTLRRPVNLSMGMSYVPQLYNQITSDMQSHQSTQTQLDQMLHNTMIGYAKNHKAAIITELNKRQERMKAEMQKKLEEEDERRIRKEKRAALRERKRLTDLKELIMKEVIQSADLQEYTPKMRIYDVRDQSASSDGVILIGGFVGELVITLTCLLDYILASPQNQNFMFTVDMVESFLTELLCGDDAVYPNNICSIKINKPLEEILEGADVHFDTCSKYIRDPQYMSDQGLALLLDIQKDLVLSQDTLESVFKVICKISTQKPQEHQEIPEIPDDAPADKKEALESIIAETKANNANIDIDNQRLEKMQKKISIVHQ